MMVKRRIRTMVEMREVIVLRSSRKRQIVFCPECSEAVVLVTLDEAMKIAEISSRAVYRLLEQKLLHFAETAEGPVLICPSTLVAQGWKENQAS